MMTILGNLSRILVVPLHPYPLLANERKKYPLVGVKPRHYHVLHPFSSTIVLLFKYSKEPMVKKRQGKKYDQNYNAVHQTTEDLIIIKTSVIPEREKMRKNHSVQNLGSAALQIDSTSVLQMARKQSPMRVQIRHIRRLRCPYSPDTHDDVHVLAKMASLREREGLPQNKTVAEKGILFSLRNSTDLERSTRTVVI